jgi:hypothetical protein
MGTPPLGGGSPNSNFEEFPYKISQEYLFSFWEKNGGQVKKKKKRKRWGVREKRKKTFLLLC